MFDLDVRSMTRPQLEKAYFDAVFALEEIGVAGKGTEKNKYMYAFKLTPQEADMFIALMCGRTLPKPTILTPLKSAIISKNAKHQQVRLSALS